MKGETKKMQNLKKKTDKIPLIQFQLFIYYLLFIVYLGRSSSELSRIIRERKI